MNKTKKAIRDLVADIDVVLELLDARAPLSSCNPLLQYLIKYKKKIRLLNKADLADNKLTMKWIKYFAKKDGSIAIAGNKDNLRQKNQLITLCQSLAPNRKSFEKPLRVMIIGIPNVGKSTLINKLVGKKSAKTGDIPAVTKANQCLTLTDSFLIYDTPGMMWQKIQYEQIGNNLALCNSIGRRALDEESLAFYLLNYLKVHYGEYLISRYKLTEAMLQLTDVELINIIGKKRGSLFSGGIIDVQKVSEIIIQDFREGRIGKITLESPELWEKWIDEAKNEEEPNEDE
ncbi:MAG: ribosome biogenesis GTPase YlqF [Burkholderiales bacterium]|nr:ribosome biogenesis GTPase YlqF [Burkholderiales bacterium]